MPFEIHVPYQPVVLPWTTKLLSLGISSDRRRTTVTPLEFNPSERMPASWCVSRRIEKFDFPSYFVMTSSVWLPRVSEQIAPIERAWETSKAESCFFVNHHEQRSQEYWEGLKDNRMALNLLSTSGKSKMLPIQIAMSRQVLLAAWDNSLLSTNSWIRNWENNQKRNESITFFWASCPVDSYTS